MFFDRVTNVSYRFRLFFSSLAAKQSVSYTAMIQSVHPPQLFYFIFCLSFYQPSIISGKNKNKNIYIYIYIYIFFFFFFFSEMIRNDIYIYSEILLQFKIFAMYSIM